MLKQYDNFTDIRHLKDQWNELAAKQANPLMSYEWYSSAAEAFHSEDTLLVFCIFENNRLTAAAPLYRDSRKSENYRLQIIGSRTLYEPGGFLYATPQYLNALLKAVTNSGYPVIFNRLLKDDLVHSSLYSNNALTTTITAASSQYLDINVDFDHYLSGLSSKRRSDLRRYRRRAESLGKIDFSISHMTANTIGNDLDIFYRIENACWKGEKASSILQNQNMQTFMNGFFHQVVEKKQAIIGQLLIDKRPIAGNLSIIAHNRLWTIKIGYDEQFSRISPGILLTHEMIRFSHDKQMTGFEFLGSSEEWINLWKPRNREYITYLYYPYTMRGLYGFLTDSGRRLMLRVNRLRKL
jgi:CelD/BcsL family acetyltransferase involved in cellulose biosynthesis